jgi:hypothetical protein
VHTRTPRPQLAAPNEPGAIALRIGVETGPGESASGRLELEEPDGTKESRRVSSRTCNEVVNALALVAAVMLDPEAHSGEVAAEPATPPIPVGPPAISPPPPLGRKRQPPPPAPPPPWGLFGGVDVGVLGGVGPALATTASAFVDLERRWFGSASTARLSVDAARTSSDLRGGTQTYEWLGSTVRLCPLYLALPGRVRVAPCAALQVAGHRGTTRNVRQPASSRQLWLAPALEGTVEWAVSSSFSVELQAGAVFPIRQSRFYLAPSSTIHEVPTLTIVSSLGVRVRFL